MAALETIRKKAVLLTVVIGLALLAFILGDLINSGQAFFGDGTTIVKVGEDKIDANEFQKVPYFTFFCKITENSQLKLRLRRNSLPHLPRTWGNPRTRRCQRHRILHE